VCRLFMGSEKYPDENEYDSYLTAHGGCCNAFTEAEQTCYHFDVQPNSLKGALDRFAQFFVAPLVLEGALEREVNSVDSEFVQVLQDDGCRLMQMQCHTANPGHPHRIFSWGNRKSLVDVPKSKGVETRPLLLDYYQKFYKPNQMSLVVLGGEPLDTLQEWTEVRTCEKNPST
jgi:nardilysin